MSTWFDDRLDDLEFAGIPYTIRTCSKCGSRVPIPDEWGMADSAVGCGKCVKRLAQRGARTWRR